jgi:opacity protein-like surface antigen
MKRILAVAVLSCLAALNAQAATKVATKTKAKAAPVAAPLPAATPEQIQAAGYVHYGDYACEFKQAIKVSRDEKNEGYVDVVYGKQSFTMKPVLSSTGALRIEDVKGVGLLLQIAYKSMLMDVKNGRRLVDGCQHEKQLDLQKADEGKPATSMMDGPAK